MRRGEAVAILKAHAPELRRLGIAHLSLFGSTARDEAGDGSDIDVAVGLEEVAIGFATIGRLDLIKGRLAALLCTTIDVVPEPGRPGPLKTAIDQDRYVVL